MDTETTGKYPLQAELCEVAAVKSRGGKVVEKFQTLLKPSHAMSQEVIRIHNITNEMVAAAPRIEDKVQEFAAFIAGGVVVAHHAPFDLGFLSIELEKAKIPLPKEPAICSSLLSRKVIPESRNHRLQTLIDYLGLKKGAAHRALDDAEACLGVLLYCIERLGEKASLQKILQLQGGPIHWGDYSMQSLCSHTVWRVLVEACRNQSEVQITYSGGSRPGQARTVKTLGMVRNPKGDFLVAQEGVGTVAKRYYLNKITAATF